MEKSQTSAMSLYDELEEEICPLTGNKYIRNLDSLPEIITWSAVKKLLGSPSLGRGCLPCWNQNLERKVAGARKVIAVLVRLGQLDSIKPLLLDGLTDNDLPLSRNGTDLKSSSSRKVFISFRTWHKGAIDSFLEKQWMVLEPSLELDYPLNDDLRIDGKCALSLAFSSCIEVTNDQNSTTQVYKATVKPRVHRNEKLAGYSVPVYVAVKKFERRKVESFTKERNMLNKIRKEGIRNDHLIKHLLICEEVPCIIFPWADGGDLGEYWHNHSSAKAPHLFVWSLRQIVGLVHALKDLHGKNCRHGDLKPANILYFTEDGVGVLKIADVGVSRVHDQETALREGITITSASTKVYEGPEVKGNTPRSRRYDCWSIGCIMLEFVLWLLYNFEAIESFWAVRKSEWHGYYHLVNANNSRIDEPLDNTEVHPRVYEAMDHLRQDPRCVGTALEALVNLVKDHLLKINFGDRLEAADLHERLERILTEVERDPSYMVNLNAVAPPIPEIFCQKPPPAVRSTMATDSTSQ